MPFLLLWWWYYTRVKWYTIKSFFFLVLLWYTCINVISYKYRERWASYGMIILRCAYGTIKEYYKHLFQGTASFFVFYCTPRALPILRPLYLFSCVPYKPLLTPIIFAWFFKIKEAHSACGSLSLNYDSSLSTEEFESCLFEGNIHTRYSFSILRSWTRGGRKRDCRLSGKKEK